ncbi:bifunctional riboflavin biosynthesis protein RIBA 1, chloroplastic-like [Eucalyptus grandis]|uniref:bifunctional riboflavin biosynthesis protein RIBA 1, chloroplastic-like n=1 Tax=Eucalyptus grandis TaxID=71139 RepID=UPI00192F07CE|nr:bifunctional riboflavin biosynthesis protein RIBA 1, chloroplastic-like [Eucalyptus grandis]
MDSHLPLFGGDPSLFYTAPQQPGEGIAGIRAALLSPSFQKLKLINLLLQANPSLQIGFSSDLTADLLGGKLTSNGRGVVAAKAAEIPGGGETLSYPGDVALSETLIGEESVGIQLQPDAVADGALAAETAPISTSFPIEDDEFDLDQPTAGFASIPEAIEDIRQGKIVVVVDDEDRENEGDLILAAEKATPEAMAFIVKYGTGIVCVSMKEEDLERLQLPLMVSDRESEENPRTAYTTTVDAKCGMTTGISAGDRATTVLALASRDSKPKDFNGPGHIFPLKYRKGGVLKRAGHLEASVDLAMLAGMEPVAVLCEVVDDDGSIARLPKLCEFAQQENLKIVSIADLIKYRRKRDKLAEHVAAARLPTMWGSFTVHCYRSLVDGIEHIVMVKGDIGDGQDVLVRVHSECLTGDIFGSARCDCGNQLALAMQKIEAAGRGVVAYLRGHEGRGIGLGHKLRAYNLQDDGRDTVEANVELGLPVDSREYGIGAQMLHDLGVRTMKLMTNNPSKFVGLRGYGLTISGRVPLVTPITEENKRYLETKRSKMGHIYGSEVKDRFSNLIKNGKPSSDVSSDLAVSD